jgi:dihydrofolate reductase
MRKLIATVFNCSLDGLLVDEGSEFWKFCFDLPENREPDDPAQLDFLQSAYAHIMGRAAYEGIAASMTTKRSTSSGWAATATSWSGAASASGGR